MHESVPLRIMFVATGLATGGAELMLLKMCPKLDRRRFAVTVVSLSGEGTIGPRLEAAGISVYALNMHRSGASVAALWRLQTLVSRLRPNVIQGWMYHGNLAASIVARRTVVVWGVRQSLYDLSKERILTRLVIQLGRAFSRSASAIVYNSCTSASQHEAFGFRASARHIIPNGFDVDLFRPDEARRASIRREIGVPDDAILIGLIARYHPMKDHETFLRAAALLGTQCPEVRFLLAGFGVSAGNHALESAITKVGLSGRVSLVGERQDTAHVNAALDIACSTSAWGEGFANVVGEAMSCGVPCVATDVGDSAMIVNDTGLLVPPRDPERLVDAWRQLIAMGSQRRQQLGLLARQRVIEHFSLGAVVTQYENLYESLLARVGV